MLHDPLVPRLSSMASLFFPDANVLSHSQDSHYNLAHSPSASTHWRGNAKTLFKLSRRTKRDIQDFILGACVSCDKEHNERSKPTGSKFIYVLNPDSSEEEQTALCVLPNVTTFTHTHNVNGAQGQEYINDETASCRASADSMMDNPSPGTLRRRGSTVSFTKMLASANEHSFPHDDHELDSDSDSDSDSDDVFSSPTPPRQTKFMAAIAEASDEEEEAANYSPIAIHVLSQYCRDPHFSGHPTCHHRARDFSYAHPASDAGTDLQERFMLKHNGEGSPAHYLNWRVLKWEYDQTMVHGPSLLRRKAPTPVGSPAKQLTLRGQESRAPTRRGNRSSKESASKVDRHTGDDTEVGVRLVEVDESEDPLSETSSLSEEVVGTGRGTEADIPGGDSPTRVVHSLPEEALLKVDCSALSQLDDADTAQILNTSHEEFVEHYENVQRQKTTRIRASIAATPQVEADKPACYVPVGAPCATIDTAPKSLQRLIQTAPPSTPEVSPTHPTHPSSSEVDSRCVSIDAPEPATHLVQTTTPPTPAISPAHLPAPLEVPSVRVATSPTRSSNESLSVRPSVFTHSASVTTKPSQDSVGSEQQQEVTNSLPPCASEPEPRVSRRLKAKEVTKKCVQTVRGTVRRGVDRVSSRVKKMGKAMRGLCGT